MNEITYRQPLNAAEIYDLAEQAYGKAPWSLATIEHDLRNQYADYLVCLVDNKAVGFVSGTLIIDELSISNIGVLPAYRGQGLAVKLLTTWLARFKTAQKVFLEVRVSNISAQRVYKKLAFKAVAIRKQYYHNPLEDAVIMEKLL
ncbi:ribosomal protein S18-alanine N-acetyltransferase [Periweissella beninensis]|uniref:[Ribosomal protein bS18]-alanine N-acetyltransferase n=1 Tax=Periweissella beninensis TaxID=504936 RepID=A0ABT0VKG6_9LACO|nr:ribosomal protein S18-alanine N-acetyltransferase [Periweissella beninensis]MBM7544645.1 ribosomal-protein-alanine N-acetyltransferase [Periweissella beninensis]MCM2436912.1 ribosomal protein S18-alanine N-acetyltransferase [Periweissella beninensis]MCT4396589.1 ribosomal-protein-alanine N-acetyltransferase [Periweissella beninensis]